MDFLQDKIKKKQFLCNYSVFLLNGMLALSIGSLLPFIRDARGLDYAFCGLIVSLHSVEICFLVLPQDCCRSRLEEKRVFCFLICFLHFRMC